MRSKTLSPLEQLPYELLAAIIAHLSSLEHVLPLACSSALRRHIYSTLLIPGANSDVLFRYAVDHGDTCLLHATLKSRPGNVNREVLLYASSWGRVEILAVLLCQPSSGSLLSELAEQEGSLCTEMLTRACRKGQLAMMHRLLALHERARDGQCLGDVAQPLDEDGQGWSPEMISRLVRAGVDTGTAEAVVPPVIVRAVRQLNVANIEQLLDLGAGRNSSDGDWRGLFDRFEPFTCSKQVLRLLLARMPVLRMNDKIWEMMLRTGCHELMDFCLSFGLDFACSRFENMYCSFVTHWPDRSEAMQYTKLLYDRGARCLASGALLVAVKRGDLENCKYFFERYSGCKDHEIFLPSLLGHSQNSHVTRYLIENGVDPKAADVAMVNFSGAPVICMLIKKERDNDEELMKCLELLISHGADISLTSDDSETLLRLSLRWYEREDLIPFLKERGAK